MRGKKMRLLRRHLAPLAMITTLLGSTAVLGPDPGLRTGVLKAQMAAPAGKAVVRVLQASLKQHQVTVSYGPDVLARQLSSGAATPYKAVSPGVRTVRFAAPGERTTLPVTMAADSVHTIVVL